MNHIVLQGPLLYQWDLDRKVEIRGMTVEEVHFSNGLTENALIVTPTVEDGVTVANIPNILLQQDKPILVYGVSCGECTNTTCEVTFPVVARQKPSDYVYTETEVQSYRALEVRLAALEAGGGGDGGGEVWETIAEAEVEDVVQTELDCNFDEYRKVIIIFDGVGTVTGKYINTHYGYPDTDETAQMCQTISATTTKRYGWVLVDTVTGCTVYTTGLNWASGGAELQTTTDSVSLRRFAGATKVIVMCVDSAGGGSVPSPTNTMSGKIKLLGVKA